MVDVISFGTKIYRKYPSTQKILGLVYRIFSTKPTFVGWGMQTNSQTPWIDEYQGKEFRKAAKEIKKNLFLMKNFEFIQIILMKHYGGIGIFLLQ